MTYDIIHKADAIYLYKINVSHYLNGQRIENILRF